MQLTPFMAVIDLQFLSLLFFHFTLLLISTAASSFKVLDIIAQTTALISYPVPISLSHHLLQYSRVVSSLTQQFLHSLVIPGFT